MNQLIMVIVQESSLKELTEKVNQILAVLESERKDSTKSWILSSKEVQQTLGICSRTLQSLRDQGKLAYSKIGRKIFYSRDDVEKLLKEGYKPAFMPVYEKKGSKTLIIHQ